MERPVQMHEEFGWQIRQIIQVYDVDRKEVEKSGNDVPRKAAIEYIIPVP